MHIKSSTSIFAGLERQMRAAPSVLIAAMARVDNHISLGLPNRQDASQSYNFWIIDLLHRRLILNISRPKRFTRRKQKQSLSRFIAVLCRRKFDCFSLVPYCFGEAA